MNLLNALAVADAKEMLRDAEMETLHELLTTVAFWEKVFPFFFLPFVRRLLCISFLPSV